MPVGFVINVKRTVHRHDSPGNIRTHDDTRTGRCATVRRVDRRAKHSHQHLARSRQVHEAMVQITCSNPMDQKHINVLLLSDSSLDQACHGIIRALVENQTTLTIILNNTREKRDCGPRRGVRKLGSKLGVGETKAPIVLGTSSTAQADAHRHSDWSSGVFEGGIAQPPPLRTFVKPAERSVSSAWPARTPLWQYVTTGRLRSPQTSDFTCSTATRNIQHQQEVEGDASECEPQKSKLYKTQCWQGWSVPVRPRSDCLARECGEHTPRGPHSIPQQCERRGPAGTARRSLRTKNACLSF